MCPPGQKNGQGLLVLESLDVRINLPLIGSFPMLNCLLKNWGGGGRNDKMTENGVNGSNNKCQCHIVGGGKNKIGKKSNEFILEENNNIVPKPKEEKDKEEDIFVQKFSKLIVQQVKEDEDAAAAAVLGQRSFSPTEKVEEDQVSIEVDEEICPILTKRGSLLKTAFFSPSLPKKVRFAEVIQVIPGTGGIEQAEEEKLAAAAREAEQQRKKLARMRLRQNLIHIESAMIQEAARQSQRRFANFLH